MVSRKGPKPKELGVFREAKRTQWQEQPQSRSRVRVTQGATEGCDQSVALAVGGAQTLQGQ